MARLIQYMTRASAFDGEWKWQAAGMCYILQLDNRELILIDGGHPADAEELVSFLEEISEGRPSVRTWILTHPHGDHIGALGKIATEPGLLGRLDIKEVCFDAPEEFTFGEGRNIAGELSVLKRIAECGAKYIRPSSGDTLTFDRARINFLFTYRDGEKLTDPNELSLVFSIEVGNKKIMFTGDAYGRPLDALAEKHADRLPCDICQLAHHALNGGSVPFYSAVGANTVLVPISRSGYEAMKAERYDKINAPARYAISHAKEAVYAFNGHTVIEL